MGLNSSGQISFGGSTSGQSINLELGQSATAQISMNDSNVRTLAGVASGQIDLNTFHGKSNNPTPEYWWRADSGLSTTGWTAYNGGVNFTFSNVSSANSTSGAYFNGSNSYGSASPGTTISAKHIFARIDSLSVGGGAILGGSFYGIHEFMYSNGYYIVEGSGGGGYSYAALAGTVGSKSTWVDFANFSSPYYTLNNGSANSLSVYAGSYTNRFWWPSGNILLGIRQNSLYGDGGYMTGYVKEVAIFTTALTQTQGQTFQSAMMARWP